MGELSLDGGLQPIKGVLPIVIEAKKQGFKGIILPKKNAKEAALISDFEIYGMENLQEVTQFLNDTETFTPLVFDIDQYTKEIENSLMADFSEVKGQESVKRALEIAAAWRRSECERQTDRVATWNRPEGVSIMIPGGLNG